MLKLKLQYLGHLMRKTDSGKYPDARKDWWQEKGTAEDEMVGWHHRLNGHEFKQALGVGDEQGSLACHSPWGTKGQTWLSNWTELSSFPGTTYWGNCLFPLLYSCLFCPRLIDHMCEMCEGLFISSLFCSTDLVSITCASTTHFISVTLYIVLSQGL